MSIITAQNLTKVYGKLPVLDALSFSVEPGEVLFISGHSGAGKSTLLRLIAGLESPSSGTLHIAGTNTTTLTKSQKNSLRQRMGIVTQDSGMLYDRTLFENVALPLLIAGYTHARIKRRVHQALSIVALEKYAKQKAGNLSLGQRQRAALARAVVHTPKIILADEPTGNLDPNLSANIMQLFMRFAQSGAAVLVVTHDLHLIQKVHGHTRALVLEHGVMRAHAHVKTPPMQASAHY